MGITPVVAALFFGGLLGLTAGFIGGKVNMSIMRVMDVFCFPSVLLAIAISGALGAGIQRYNFPNNCLYSANCACNGKCYNTDKH